MFVYDIVERVDQTFTTLATFKATWAASVPIFHDLAKAYFALGRRGATRELLLYATIEDDDEPDMTALVCSARFAHGDADDVVEILSGPLLERALRRRLHPPGATKH
jgi:hypothetical protein